MAANPSLDSGTIIGKYVIRRELGCGGMGVVYLAEDSTLSREIALKLLYSSLSSDALFIDRFKQEARVVASIMHPNIVRINSFETLDQSMAIDMEFVPGPSLGQAMSREPFTPQLAVQVASDTLEGLAVCHDLGIVHRDIKPNNILLSPDGRAKLADFGLATAYATHMESTVYRMSSASLFMGTPRWAPPEAWEGAQPRPDWDLYSLGIVLYEGLLGKAVYDGATPLAIVKQLTSIPVRPLRDQVPGVSHELGEFVDQLISQDRTKRPANATAALERLRALPEYQQTIRTDAPTIRAAVRRFHRKSNRARRIKLTRRASSWSAGILAVALLSGFGSWLAFTPRNPLPVKTNPAVTSDKSPTQDIIFQHRLPTVDDVLGHSKAASTKLAGVFDARYFRATGSGTPRRDIKEAIERTEKWLITASSNGTSRRVFGMSDRFLMTGELNEDSAGLVLFDGNWSSYAFNSAAGFQDGSVEGSGEWMVPGEALHLSMNYVNARDHSTQTLGAAISVAEHWKTDSRFAYEIENAPLAQSLLFSELMPRETSWANSIVELLPSVYNQTCLIPQLAKDDAITVDGQLSETVWAQAYFDAKGRIGSMEGFPSNARFEARSMPASICLAFGSGEKPTGPWVFRVAIMPMIPAPPVNRGVMQLSWHSDNRMEAGYYIGGVERPWIGEPWQVAAVAGQAGVTCEISIPVASLVQSASPGKNVFWRLNAVVAELDEQQNEKPIAMWGFPDFTAVEHGALLRFTKYAQ